MRKGFLVLAIIMIINIALISPIITNAQNIPESIRVNVGGGEFIDGNGLKWSADKQYKPLEFGYINGGNRASATESATGTANPQLYKEQVYGANISYRFDVPNGNYKVKLHFAEFWFNQKAQRVFDISLQGNKIREGYDIFAEVGRAKADVVEAQLGVVNNKLIVELLATTENVTLAGIEVEYMGQINIIPPKFKTTGDGEIKLNDKSNGYNLSSTQSPFFAYSDINGNFEISSKINCTNGYSGIRTETGDNYATVYVDNKGVGIFEYKTDGYSASYSVNIQNNVYLRLTNVDGIITAFYSIDGSKWELIGLQSKEPSFKMSSKCGIFVTGGKAEFQEIIIDYSEMKYERKTVRVNVGGGKYIDKKGNEWAADRQYTSGGGGYTFGNIRIAGTDTIYNQSTANTNKDIKNTDDDYLYQTTRYNNEILYRFDGLENGTYTVKYHFAESYKTLAGQRVFNASLQGETVLENYDILIDAGFDTAVVKEFTTKVSDGTLFAGLSTIHQFQDFSTLCAIEVIPSERAPQIVPDINKNSARTVSDSGKSGRQEINLNSQKWKIWLDEKAEWENDKLYLPNEVEIDKMPQNKPSIGWNNMLNSNNKEINVPTTVEQIFSNGDEQYRYHGVSWFWSEMNVPKDWEGKTIRFNLEKARLRVELYVNERLAGYDIVAETPVSFDISDYLKYGKSNNIAIRITNPSNGGRGWADFPIISWGQYLLPSSHDYSGILGNVGVVATNNTYIDDVFVKNLLPAKEKNIEILVSTKNLQSKDVPINIKTEIFPLSGGDALYIKEWSSNAAANSISETSITDTVPNAMLWDIDNPNLYKCKVSITGNGIQDEYTVNFGFRVFEARKADGGDDFYLNGERIRIKTAIDWGYYYGNGIFATPEQGRKSVQAAKSIGQNGINFHRKIGEPRVMESADELGLLLYEEPGGFHAGGQDYNLTEGSFGAKYMLEKVRRMGLRDRNHASVIMYNLCNEDQGWSYSRKKAIDLLNAMDGTRFVSNTSFHGKTFHMRPYEMVLRDDLKDVHTTGSFSFFDEKEIGTHREESVDNLLYWGEVRFYSGNDNFYELGKQENIKNGVIPYDYNYYNPLARKIKDYFERHNIANTGSGVIKTAGDVAKQAGRSILYINGRIAQNIMVNDTVDGFAINGWSGGMSSKLNTAFAQPDKGYSSMVDGDRNLKAPAEDYAYWVRPLQLVLQRISGKYINAGEISLFDVFLINEGILPQGKYQMKIKILDGNGQETGDVSFATVDVKGGIVFAQKVYDAFEVDLKKYFKGGYITVDARLIDGNGNEVANGKEQILLSNRSSFGEDIESLNGAVVDWDSASTALIQAGGSGMVFSSDMPKLDYIVADGVPEEITEIDNILDRVKNDGTRLVLKFNENWADVLYKRGILSAPVKKWGGSPINYFGFDSNGWGYLDYFIGNQAVPSKSTIGTNSWEIGIPANGFYPFESKYKTRAYGAIFQYPDSLFVILSTIEYGKGHIVLAPSYPVDNKNAFCDMLFYNIITKEVK